ncbi:ABC transporter permease [Aestuariibius sp. 2305UL40-4]|uniref:ABC transporter permease n=1 Tax=Aestuariibius violaceus TaxID=3234132 RepID=UPI00345F0EF5
MLSTAVRFARRELRGGLRGFRIFLACLALGVAAIAAVGSVRAAIQAGLEREGAALLGGDAELRYTYRYATEDERAWMDANALAVSEIVDFRSLATTGEGTGADRGLTQVKAIDGLYPLIGEVVLTPDIPLADALSGNGTLPGAVMERQLSDRMALAPGDTFRLGTQDFVLTATMIDIPDANAGGFALGPTTIVLLEDLANSGLLAEGTLFESRYRLDLPDGANLDALRTEVEQTFPQGGARWSDARNGAPGIAQFVDRLGAFLVLVGLSGLAVGGVGVSAAVRAYLAGKTSTIATLKTLGATRATIFLTYFLQVGALTIVGIALGLILGGALPLLFAPLIEARLPVPAEFTIHPAPLAEAALYGLLAALVFTLWPLARTEDVRAATLFRDGGEAGGWLPRPGYIVATFAILAILIAAAATLTDALTLTLYTAAGIAGSLVILALAALAVRALARRSTTAARGRPALRAALGAIGGPRSEAISVVLSLGLGLTVLASVGQIDGNLRQAIARDLPEVAPSFFFVDIQPDQLEGFNDRLATDPAVSRVDTAPMLRGIISQINGQPARQVAGDHWVLDGDRGVTYNAAQPENTTLTEGEWWPEDYTGPPLISFAAEEGAELDLEIGDEITINILGRDITATIASFREVDFSTAGIGFILSMNPAALAGAPHTHIATVYAEQEAEAQILRDLANAYPNITGIAVRDGIARASDLLDGIAAAVSYGAAATLLTGFLVLIGAAAAGERARTTEAAILKTIGATRRRILTSFALRAALLGFAAGCVALLAGIIGGWSVTTFIMDTSYAVIWGSALPIILGGIAATLLAGLAFAWRPLAARPAQVLRARE